MTDELPRVAGAAVEAELRHDSDYTVASEGPYDSDVSALLAAAFMQSGRRKSAAK
jgi:hypothetical protein